MRNHFSKFTRAAAVLMAVGVMGAFALTASAQAPGGGGFQARGGLLDDQQQSVYREALQKESEALKSLDEKLRAAQKELVAATLAEKYDEKVVREKAEAVAKIQVEITVLRARALATVAPTLKADQKENLLTSRFTIMMLNGGMDMMGRGGMGGQGGPGGQGGQGGGRGGRGQGGQGGQGGNGNGGGGRPPRTN